METFSTFRKLWGRIEVDLEPKIYNIEIFDSKIYIILNTKILILYLFIFIYKIFIFN
jgi:hypothetical protein